MKRFMNKLKGDKHETENEVDQSDHGMSSSTTQQSMTGTHPASHDQMQQQQQPMGGAMGSSTGGAMGSSTGSTMGSNANVVGDANGVILNTTLGKITIALYSDKTPRVSFGQDTMRFSISDQEH